MNPRRFYSMIGFSNDCPKKVITSSSFSLHECDHFNDNSTACSIRDTNCHEDREAELKRKSDEETNIVDQGVVAESIVSRSEPANIGERYEENAKEDGETKGGAIINTKDEGSTE